MIKMKFPVLVLLACPLFVNARGLNINDFDESPTRDENNITSVACDDHVTSCYNGSKCIPIGSDYVAPFQRTFRCDCSPEITNKFALYAGYECEYSARETCIIGPDASKSFCTNGNCKMVWSPVDGEKAYHKGCECDDGFEGDFCEYKDGHAPVLNEDNGAIDNKPSPWGIIVGIILPVSLFVCLLILRRRRHGEPQTEIETKPNGTGYDKEII